jgi:hypothetical protein
MKAALIRAQVESALEGRVLSPFIDRPQQVIETVPTGAAEIDALTGGLPRGGLTEIFGPDSSGRTSLLHAILASATGREEECALVDASDTFDPCSAPGAGVDLRRLLWVRCTHLEQALKATDLLLAGGGFGLVVADLGNVPPKMGRRVPLASWFRFRRAVEHTPTLLVFLEREPYAKTCATLVLRLEPGTVCWTGSGGRDSGFGIRSETGNWKLETGKPKFEIRRGAPCGHPASSPHYRGDYLAPRAPTRGAPTVSHACLLHGLRPKVEVIRSRLPDQETSVVRGPLSVAKEQLSAISGSSFQPSALSKRSGCLAESRWLIADG